MRKLKASEVWPAFMKVMRQKLPISLQVMEESCQGARWDHDAHRLTVVTNSGTFAGLFLHRPIREEVTTILDSVVKGAQFVLIHRE